MEDQTRQVHALDFARVLLARRGYVALGRFSSLGEGEAVLFGAQLCCNLASEWMMERAHVQAILDSAGLSTAELDEQLTALQERHPDRQDVAAVLGLLKAPLG